MYRQYVVVLVRAGAGAGDGGKGRDTGGRGLGVGGKGGWKICVGWNTRGGWSDSWDESRGG